MANISLGERVRRTRIRNALTQADLGAKIGVTGATISNWETGKTVPNHEQKAELKKVLGGLIPDLSETGEQTPVDFGSSPFGVWLNKTRLEKRLSVAELAEASQLSAPAIYNLESGRIANPRSETIRRLERALGVELPAETRQEIRTEATVEGVGEFKEFNPHDEDEYPSVGGIYVLYDISERPIYVGQGADIKARLRAHREKFWFKAPIVESGAYIGIEDKGLREKVEALLIRFLKSMAVINKQNVDRGE